MNQNVKHNKLVTIIQRQWTTK